MLHTVNLALGERYERLYFVNADPKNKSQYLHAVLRMAKDWSDRHGLPQIDGTKKSRTTQVPPDLYQWYQSLKWNGGPASHTVRAILEELIKEHQ